MSSLTLRGIFNAFFCKDAFEIEEERRKMMNKYTFKPFEKVLVRDRDSDRWNLSFFSYERASASSSKEPAYVCINGASYFQCIPYEGNEYLLGGRSIKKFHPGEIVAAKRSLEDEWSIAVFVREKDMNAVVRFTPNGPLWEASCCEPFNDVFPPESTFEEDLME